MAEFTDQEKELLDKLRKGFERDGKTRSELEPWQEHLERSATVNASKASAAAKILEGFSGSWAAQYNYGYGSNLNPTGNLVSEAVAGNDPQGPPLPVRSKTSKIGFRGLPEINFVPYNWGTNTFGSKGPSLVGHPIGFSIIGPTLKSPVMDWTWRVLPGAGIGGGDALQMDVRADGGANVMQPYSGFLNKAYGPYVGGSWVMGTDQEPNGGMYLAISDDGLNGGSLPAGRVPMQALDQYTDTARFELFRIAQIPLFDSGIPYQIHLHPDKPLSRYFDISGDPNLSVRAITIYRPHVTRLAAIPQSGAVGGSDGTSTFGREQTFVVVPPEFSAGGDNYPPFDGGTPGDGTWLQGGFSESRAPGSSSIGGELLAYNGLARLPIPRPVAEFTGRVERTLLNPSRGVGQWVLGVSDNTFFTSGLFSSAFPIVRVTATRRDDDLESLTFGTIENCLGWFDMVGTDIAAEGGDQIILNRVAETDPQTGLTYWGPGPFISDPLANRDVSVFGTIHEAVGALWEGSFDLDQVEAARITNLIDPKWVGRFEKQLSDPLLAGGGAPAPGSGAGRPDRAIFDTQSFPSGGAVPFCGDPGNLMDLGFRMVLFPAKPSPLAPATAIPDFDNPITGREVVIDGSINEKQYIDIDYSAGIVRLSHPPPTSRSGVPDEPSDIIPNGIVGTGDNNTRGEVILYAACVPYSMEDSQVGTGLRLTTREDASQRDFDAYSTEVSAKIDLALTAFTGTDPYIGVSPLTGNVEIVLDRLWEGPETGVITIRNGSHQGSSFGIWGYTTKTQVTRADGARVTALGGITNKSGSLDPDPSLSPGSPTRFVVLRREVFFGRESVSLPFATDTSVGDTYYGSSVRADTLRFERSKLEPKLDGSMLIRPLPNLGFQDRVYGRLTPSKMTYPIGNVTLGTASGNYFAEEGLLMGLDYQNNAGDGAGGLYVLSNFGPALALETDPSGTSWAGYITVDGFSQGQFAMTDNFRFVAKVSNRYRANVAAKAFIGLVQDDGALGFPTVDLVTQGPLGEAGGVGEVGLTAGYSVIGFHLNNYVAGSWRFWTRGSSGVDNVVDTDLAISDPTVSLVTEAYYFVIEVQRYGALNPPTGVDPAGVSSSCVVKMGVFDSNKQLLRTINVTQDDQLPDSAGPGLILCGGIRHPLASAVGRVELYTHNVSIVLEKDLGTFDLPWLP